jgi:hypothetical protein
MTQTSLLHCRQSFSDPNCYGLNSQKLVCGTHQQVSKSSIQFNNFRKGSSMAQQLLVGTTSARMRRWLTLVTQQQYVQEGDPSGQQWQWPQVLRQPATTPYTGRTSNDFAYQQGDLWGPNSMQNQSVASNSTLQLPPHIISGSDGFAHSNNELVYPGMASRELAGEGGAAFGGRLHWFPPRPTELRYDLSANKSDPDTNSSCSPKSFVSESQCSQMSPFTPEPVANAADWGCYAAPSYAGAKVSSPKDMAESVEDAAIVDYSGLPRYGCASSPTPAGTGHYFNGMPMVYGVPHQYDPEISSSQGNSPEVSPWFPDNLRTCMPYRPRELQVNGASINSAPINSASINSAPVNSAPVKIQPNEHQAHSENDENGTSREAAMWNRAHRSDRPQERFQDNFPSQQAQDTRKADDAILLRGKRDGLTYKEISKKMHTKCAESTLRGRYRALTKARQDRVRKPVWRETDVS